MRQYIFAILSAVLLFSACADEQLDRFAIDDVSVGITQTWEGKYPHFEVKVKSEQGNNVGKVKLRLFYHDQVLSNEKDGETKDIELTGADGSYSYTAKDFPYAFTGDTYKAFAYVEEAGYMINSEVLTMTVPGSYAPEVTAGTFVFSEATAEHQYGFGDIHLYGSNFSRHLSVSKYDQDVYLWMEVPVAFDVYPEEVIIHNCKVMNYGENEVTIRQGENYTFKFDVPGLKIDSVDKTVARFGETITMKVSGMKPDCTYEVYDAKVVSAEDGTIKFVPNQYWQNQKIQLIEKHYRNNAIMYCYYGIPISVR